MWVTTLLLVAIDFYSMGKNSMEINGYWLPTSKCLVTDIPLKYIILCSAECLNNMVSYSMRVSSEGVSDKGNVQKIRNVVDSHWSKVYFLTRGVSVMFVLVVHLCVSLCTVSVGPYSISCESSA